MTSKRQTKLTETEAGCFAHVMGLSSDGTWQDGDVIDMADWVSGASDTIRQGETMALCYGGLNTADFVARTMDILSQYADEYRGDGGYALKRALKKMHIAAAQG